MAAMMFALRLVHLFHVEREKTYLFEKILSFLYPILSLNFMF